MIEILENSEVHLLNVPLENNYKNQVLFDTTIEQADIMKTKIAKDFNKKPLSFTGLTYIRKDNVLRIPKHIDELYTCNYLMYNNNNFAHKWFYAFITDMRYVNPQLTEITIETDVWQTWFKEITLKESFVEREHVSVQDDNNKYHTFPETLETGEYIVNTHEVDQKSDGVASDMCYVIASTLSKEKSTVVVDGVTTTRYLAAGGGKYNGVYSGVKYYRCKTSTYVDELLENYVNAGQGEGVNGLFMIPKWLAPTDSEDGIAEVKQTSSHSEYNNSTSKNLTLDGYTPRNKKLLTYPFNYLLVSNNNGANAIYKYEDFDDKVFCSFVVKGAICPGGSIRMTPTAYKGVSEYDEESINLGKFPICNWTTDMYTNWMVKNSASIQNSQAQTIISGAAGTIGGILSLDLDTGLSSAANAYFDIKSSMLEIQKQQLTPPQANGNVNCGDVIASSSKNTFHFYKMSIKKEFAEKLDKYFDMYGYQVNTVKIPNINNRPCWNFVKTIGVNIDGAIPQNDLTKIREMFDSGVTFWKSFAFVEDYSLDNRTN